MMKKTIAALGILSLVLVMVLSGPVSVSAETPKSGGVLKLLCRQIPPSYNNPKERYPIGMTAYLFPAVETLLGDSPDGVVPTKLATSWDVASDGKSVTFHLRKNVKFHDGNDFDAEAVKWNLDKIRNKRPELKIITSIDVVDKHTIKLNLTHFSNTLLHHFTWYDGIMVSPAAIEGKDKPRLVGTGPFEFVSAARDTKAVFKKFDGYWDKGKPYLDGIEYIPVRDPNTARNALLSGQAQAWTYVPEKYIKELTAGGYKINSCPGVMRVVYGDSTNSDSVYANKKIRQAIDHAIDKEGIAKTFGVGLWEATNQPVASSVLGYIPGYSCRTYDPEKAKQLLKEAGYPKGFKTKIYAKGTVSPQVVAAFQANLIAVGVDAEIVKLDSAKSAAMAAGGWKDGLFVTGVGMVGTYATAMETDRPSPTKAASAKVTPEFLDLLSKASAATDRATEKKLNQDLVRLVCEESIITPLAIESRNCSYKKTVHIDLDTISIHFWNPGNTWLE